MRRRCVWCAQPLEFREGNRDGTRESRAWRHPDGEIYQGRCYCPGFPHRTLHDATGRMQCRTWRDDHCALADMSPTGAVA